MKVVAVMAIHIDSKARMAITIASIKRLHRRIPDIVLVGDTSIEQTVADFTGCYYVNHPNLPLDEKYQAGFTHAHRLNPDAVMMAGSDSWHTDNWCSETLTYMRLNGLQMAGKSRWYVLNLDNGKLVMCEYDGLRAFQPEGNGRIVTRGGMEMLNWQLFPGGVEGLNGIEASSHNHALAGGLNVGVTNELNDVHVLEIKSNAWASINPWSAFEDGIEVQDTHSWLEENFPGSISALEAIRKEYL